jgi:hypothetical protein
MAKQQRMFITTLVCLANATGLVCGKLIGFLWATLVIVSLGCLCFAVPKGHARIAQRFNAGLDVKRSQVPKGRLRSNPTPNPPAGLSEPVCLAGLSRLNKNKTRFFFT